MTAAASFVVASTTIFLPYDTQLGGFLRTNLDLFYAFGASGLGLSLYLIHIYVTEIKRTLQALWVLGALGSLVSYASFAQPAGKHLVDYVIQYPSATWLVGPLFAALTGLVFKEGTVFSVFFKKICLRGLVFWNNFHRNLEFLNEIDFWMNQIAKKPMLAEFLWILFLSFQP